VITKLADPKPLLRAHWGPKDAASHGPGKIKVTKAGPKVECGTGLIIGKILEARLGLF
jgi:hypothetical protein